MPCDDCSRAETCPPCVNGDARFELFNELRQWMHSHTANELIDAFAHQLAEQQRRYAEDTLDCDAVIEPGQLKTVVVAAVSVVADLIDPKVRS